MGLGYAPKYLYNREHLGTPRPYLGLSADYTARFGWFAVGVVLRHQESTVALGAHADVVLHGRSAEISAGVAVGAAAFWREPRQVTGLGPHVEARARVLFALSNHVDVGCEGAVIVESFELVPPPSEHRTLIGAVPAAVIGRFRF